VAISVTTLDRQTARKMEPRAATPGKRLEAIAGLAGAGVPVAVMVAPIIPALNDSEIEAILAAARRAGASEAGYVLLRLPLEIKDLFEEWLEAHFPARAKHVLSLVRSMMTSPDERSRANAIESRTSVIAFVDSGKIALVRRTQEDMRKRLGPPSRRERSMWEWTKGKRFIRLNWRGGRDWRVISITLNDRDVLARIAHYRPARTTRPPAKKP